MSISRVEPTRAAMSECGAVEVRNLDVVGLEAGSCEHGARRVDVACLQRARDRACTLALLGREARIPRREREPVVVARGLDDPDLDRHVEVADELLDDRDLLRVLLAEPRDLRADEVEELEADGGDAAEVAGTVRALEPFGGAAGLDPRREPVGYISSAGGANTTSTPCSAANAASRSRSRGYAIEVGRLGELRRVDEDACDQHVAFGPRRREQRGVAVVQRAHRRDETDDPVPRQVELADRARDDHGCVASASAS